MKAIIVYSGKGGVGKTTTTANIARLFAEQGNKVFIIDADLLQAREKLAIKIANVRVAEERMKLKIKQIQEETK